MESWKVVYFDGEGYLKAATYEPPPKLVKTEVRSSQRETISTGIIAPRRFSLSSFAVTKPLYFQPNGKDQVQANLKAAEYEPPRKLVKTEDTLTTRFGETYSAVAIGDEIYILSWRKLFDKLSNPSRNGKWQCESKNSPKHLHGKEAALAVVKGKIYAFGGGWANEWPKIKALGERKPQFSNDCECFDVDTGEWTDIKDMSEEKRLHSVISVKDRIYSVGGIGRSRPKDEGEDSGKALANVEEYNPVTNHWEKKCSLLKARIAPGLAELDGNIYAIGGGGDAYGGPDFGRLSCIEWYDASSDQWFKTELELSVGRMSFNPVIINNEIIALGGDGTKDNDKFSTGKNWEKIGLDPNFKTEKKAEDIPGAASIMSLAVVWIK